MFAGSTPGFTDSPQIFTDAAPDRVSARLSWVCIIANFMVRRSYTASVRVALTTSPSSPRCDDAPPPQALAPASILPSREPAGGPSPHQRSARGPPPEPAAPIGVFVGSPRTGAPFPLRPPIYKNREVQNVPTMKISEEGCRVVDDGKEKLQDTDGKKYELPAGKLKLKIDGPFLNLIGTMLAWGRDAPAYSDYTFKRKYDELEAAQNQYEGKKERRRRPKRVPGQALYVGDKKFDRTDDQKVCAKFLYNRQCIECVIIKSEISRKVTIPFGDITSLTLQLDRASVDVLNIEVKTSLRSFCAPGTAKPLKRSHLVWTADYNVDDSNSFPESRYFCLEVEKGTLERSFAKLVYSYPKLLRVLRIYQGSAHVDGSPPTPMFPPSPLLPDNNSSDGDKESTKSL